MSLASTASTVNFLLAVGAVLLTCVCVAGMQPGMRLGPGAGSTDAGLQSTSFAVQHPSDAAETGPADRASRSLTTLLPSLPAATYSLTITESGLPAGTPWAAQILANCSGSEGLGTTTNSVVFTLPNGTYEWNVNPLIGYAYDPSPSAGAVTIAGSSEAVSVVYVPGPQTIFAVMFAEHGLPIGATWEVNLSGNIQSTTVGVAAGSLLVFQDPNGTYPFSVGTSSEYAANPEHGAIAIHGGYLFCQPVAFAPEYTVSFGEGGLPAGLTWSVTLNGTVQKSTAGSIEFEEPNGTYEFAVATADEEYAPTSASGLTVVNGGPVSESVTFQLVTYTVTFTEKGAPTGTEWWVNLSGGQSHSATDPTMTFPEPNGTYSYSASAPGLAGQTGNLTVSGESPSVVVVNFSSRTPPSVGLPLIDYAIIGGVLVAACAIGVVTVLFRRRRKTPPVPVTARS